MQAVIFIGVQASGKSTFFKERFFDTHVRINLDMLKTRPREKIILEACLQGRQSFVVDNTNPTIEDRRRYILPAKEGGFEVLGYYFESTMAASLERNQGRVEKQPIPIKGILATYHKLQAPTFREGFDKIFYVKINSQGEFVIEEQQD